MAVERLQQRAAKEVAVRGMIEQFLKTNQTV
jgi:hypothetical protein